MLEREAVNDRVPRRGLDAHGIATGAEIFWNLTTAPLVEHAVRRGEGLLAKDGPLVVRTGKHTGRSAQDKFTVKDDRTEDVIWWNSGNKPMDSDAFERLYDDFLLALADKDQLYAADLYGGSQPEHRVKVRVINELAWHNLFIRTLLVRPKADELPGFDPEFLIIDLPSFRADPERHGCRSETVIAVNFSKKADPDRRNVLRRRDEEVGLRPFEFHPSDAGHHADALLRQHRTEGGHGDLLRP